MANQVERKSVGTVSLSTLNSSASSAQALGANTGRLGLIVVNTDANAA